MPQTSLLLSASRASWATPTHHGTRWDKHPKMKELRQKILERDDHTCQGCGWRAEQWQDIHHRNDNHADFSESNLETLCPLCHQVFHLPQAAATGGGSVIFLPEISQADLNLLCIGLFVAMKTPKGKWSGIARTLFSLLEARKSIMESQVGRSDPGVLAQVLLNMSPEEYAQRDKRIGHLRLLPFASRFQAAIEYWETQNFKQPPQEQWEKLLPEDIQLANLMPASAAS